MDKNMEYETVENVYFKWIQFIIDKQRVAQQAEAFFDKILDTINETYPGLISMLQGFQKCIE